MFRKVLLACGVLASVLYIGTDIFAAMRYEGYSYAAHSVSELSAIGAPTRPLAVPLFFTYAVLLIPFGLGIWRSANRNRVLRVVAGLVVGYGALCLAGPFTPMHQRSVLAAGGGTLTDTLHIAGAMVDVACILLIIGFGATAFEQRFRLYSIGTILVLLVFGAFSAVDGPRVAANLPTPWLGVTERLTIYASMLWFAVLAITLLRIRDAAAPEVLAGKEDRAPGRAIDRSAA